MNGQNLTKFCIHIIIDKIYVGIINHHFLQICNRVTAIIFFIIFVSAQYLENQWHKFATELRPLIDVRISFPLNILRTNGQNFNQILYTHYH